MCGPLCLTKGFCTAYEWPDNHGRYGHDWFSHGCCCNYTRSYSMDPRHLRYLVQRCLAIVKATRLLLSTDASLLWTYSLFVNFEINNIALVLRGVSQIVSLPHNKVSRLPLVKYSCKATALCLGCRAAGRGVRVMCPLPCGGICFLCPYTSAHLSGTCGACCFVVHGSAVLIGLLTCVLLCYKIAVNV